MCTSLILTKLQIDLTCINTKYKSYECVPVLLRSFFCEICNFMTYETKKNVPFFYKERKRTQRSFRSFIKNGKERKDRNVLL